MQVFATIFQLVESVAVDVEISVDISDTQRGPLGRSIPPSEPGNLDIDTVKPAMLAIKGTTTVVSAALGQKNLMSVLPGQKTSAV